MDAVSEAVAVMHQQLAALTAACDELSHRELIGLLAELTQVVRTIPTLEHRVLARLTEETEPARLGEKSWPAVLTTAVRVSSAEAKRRLHRAQMLGPRRAMSGEPLAPVWESTAAAQARGVLDAEHVEVIVRFHHALPVSVDPGIRAAADRHLAELAAGLDPENLAAAAKRLLTYIDQDGPEPDETERARRRGIVLGPQQSDGSRTIRGRVSAEAGSYWEAIFAKEAAPGHHTPDSTADTRTQAQRNHDAFLAVGRRALGSGELGTHNGLPVTVIVSTTLQDLEEGAGVAMTGGGSLLPMADLIRMAARAHHYLYVYDEHTGQSLYLGRAKRLANAAQRIVLHARDRGCTRPGCTAPGYWCQAHHAVSDWKTDGQTDIDDLAFACGPDNRVIENTDWTTRKNSKNRTEWIPPPDLDRGLHRVNGYHHPERYLLPEDEYDVP